MPLSAGNLTRDEAARRHELISDVRYRIDLDLTDQSEGVRGYGSTTTIEFRCAEPGAETFLDLSALSVGELVVNGERLDPAGHVDGARIALPGLAEHNEVRVVATCEYQHSGVGLHRFVDPVDGSVYLHTQFEPFDAHRVFACFDQPDLKAPHTFAVTAPESWEVISNYAPTSREGGRWEFQETVPLSTYVVAVVAGPFHVFRDRHGDVELGVFCRQSMAEHVDHEEMFAVTKAGMDTFGAVFDFPYPFGKYDQLFVPEFNFGAMENPGCVTFSERYIHRGHVTEAEREARANTTLHELAHMWFGDLTTMRWWDDLWLNESFATFMATWCLARSTRFTNSWVTFANEDKAWATKQDQLPTTHPISTDAPDLETALQNFDGITYAKGASVLRQLVAYVGEDAFFAGCRNYFARFAYGNAELRDFLAELEAASGRDLATWAKEWLQTSGMNTLAVEFEVTDGAYTSFEVEQTGTEEHPTLRPHRVAVGLYDRDGSRLALRRRAELDVTGPSTTLDAFVGEEVADLILVNDEDLTFAKLRLDERSIATVTEHLADLREPLPRALIWAYTWDMVRDAALPARRFIEIVRNNVDGETDVGVLQTLLTRTRTGTLLYSDPARRDALLAELAGDARRHVEDAEPGSDHQLAWARHWIATVREHDAVAAVVGLLDGTTVFPGLEVDTELRWHIVRALAGVGALGDEDIAAEHDRDRTDVGARHAAAARAAQPLETAKASAWEAVVEDEDLSHSMMKAIMGGFLRPDQVELLRPYVDRYFDALLPFWERRQMEVALAFIERMYPTVVVDQYVVDRTDAFLEGEDVPKMMRRSLLEQRDGVVRAIRARELDAST